MIEQTDKEKVIFEEPLTPLNDANDSSTEEQVHDLSSGLADGEPRSEQVYE